MFDCGCHDNDLSNALNMAFFVHSPWKPTTTQKNNGGFKNLFPTLLPFLQESLLTSTNSPLCFALWRWTLYAYVNGRFKVTRPAYFKVEIFRVTGARVSKRFSRSRLLVSISFDFGKYGLEPRV